MSRLLGSSFAMIVGLAVLVVHAAAAAPGDDVRIAKGFAIAPVPLNLNGLDRNLVGLGSYLVNGVGGCNDCHTNPPYAQGGNPFLGQRERINRRGYLAGGTPFGPVVSRNITPDAKRRPGGLTYEQFVAAIRRGQDADNPGRLLQVMPWPVYGKMTANDLRAVFEYLRAIPRIQN
jgi:hypothetical protein